MPAGNKQLALWRVKCFDFTLQANSKFVLRLKYIGKNTPPRKAAKTLWASIKITTLDKIKKILKKNYYGLIRIFVFIAIIGIFIFISQRCNAFIDIYENEILKLLISAISILIAIIITFLFSKLFSEKETRIQRKKEIDQLSSKVTYLRRLAFHIRGAYEFWRFKNGTDIKSVIDTKYKELTYEEYRGYTDIPGVRDLGDRWSKINEEIHGTVGQAYLALKGLEDEANMFSFFIEFNPQNYSLLDIVRYKEYAGSFWSFLDRSDRSIIDLNNMKEYDKKNIDDLYLKIKGIPIDRENYTKEIKDLLSDFGSIIFEKHYYLNSKIANNFPSFFKNAFLNMLIFVVILLSALLALILNPQDNRDLLTELIIAIFMANTVDLILFAFKSIKNELRITDIFQL